MITKRGRKYRKGVFVVLYSKTKAGIKYLLFKRHKHWRGWEFVKGGCEAKETYRKCVLREVKEETGLKPLNMQWYCKRGKYRWKNGLEDRPGFIGQTYILTSCEITDKGIKIDKGEHSGYKWVNFKQALKMLTYANQRTCLKMVNKRLS